MAPKDLQCLTCGWMYPVEDSTSPEDWVNHGDFREPTEAITPCPDPQMEWVEE